MLRPMSAQSPYLNGVILNPRFFLRVKYLNLNLTSM
jgi:hypothetical protein